MKPFSLACAICTATLFGVVPLEWMMASTPGAASAESTSSPAPAPRHPLEDMLTLKTKLAFGAQSLEFCLRDLVIDAQTVAKGTPFAKGGKSEFAIKIIGPDLIKEGITRNQTIRDFDEEGTIAELLTALVQRGNRRLGKAVNDPEQKLVWVIGPDPDDPAKQTILITTRAAAAEKKYLLPAEFQLNGK